MKRTVRSLTLALAAAFATLSARGAAAGGLFDPTADAATALRRAEVQAARERKNILLDVGGDWCVWCVLLDRTLHADPALDGLLTKNFVVVHVNVSPENENRKFLSRYPQPAGYPFFLVLSPTGRLLHAQETDDLQHSTKSTDGYDPARLAAFLRQWGQRR